jgi:hypothetical protein
MLIKLYGFFGRLALICATGVYSSLAEKQQNFHKISRAYKKNVLKRIMPYL